MANHQPKFWQRPWLPSRFGGLLIVAAAFAAGPLLPQPGSAQSEPPLNEIRALNFARDYAVRLNGGLIAYRPAQCMFTTSAPSNPCLIRSDGHGFTFRFLGGPPGWLSENKPASKETELKVAPDGRSLVKLIYNGPPR